MPEVTRVSRSSYAGRERDDYSSDDERSTYSRSRHGGESSYRTVQRYRVTPSRTDDWDDRRSHHTAPRAERIEVDTRRTERFVEPERPRSAIDVGTRSTVVDRYIEVEPAREAERERTRTVVYERERESPRDRDSERRPWERSGNRPWESEQNVRETDVRIEKRTTERREDPAPEYEVERYQRETEYYDRPEPAPQPIIIRQRAPEPQQIIVQEAAPPVPIVVPRPEPSYEIVRREEVSQEIARPEPRREEDEYYYRRDVREVGSRREEDIAVARYDRRNARRHSISDGGYSDGEAYTRTRRIVRERSTSPRHKRHLAEGALAGAGAAALIANHRSKQGNGPEHRGRNVVGGAALGAIGTEIITRARSRYRESHDGRSRSRSSSRSKVKTGIGLAAAALATAAAVKYVQNRKANKEEQLVRGRSRTRSRRRRSSRGSSYYSSTSERVRSVSKHRDPKHRASSVAKAGAATAGVAAVVQHFRNKSRKRNGSRSKSRIRSGAEIVGTGLAGAAVAGLYENRKAKEEEKADHEHVRRERRRSRSRARSIGVYSDPGVDPELGMVQYGTEPVSVYQQTTTNYYDPALAAGGAGAAYGATRHHRSRSRSHRRRGSSSSIDSRQRSRSRSRVRDIAGAAAATGAAAIGINQYKKRKEKKELERERERRREDPQSRRRRSRSASSIRSTLTKRYEEETPSEDYYARSYDDYSQSPPRASSTYFPPEQPVYPPAPTATMPPMPSVPVAQPAGFTQNIHVSTPNVTQPPIPPYNPQDYPPPPTNNPYYNAPPRGANNVSVKDNLSRQTATPFPTASNTGIPSTSAPYFPPPPTSPFSEDIPDPVDRAEARDLTPVATSSPTSETPHNKSVMFAPMSPTSSHRLAKIRKNSQQEKESEQTSNSRGPPLQRTPENSMSNDHDQRSRGKRRRSIRRRNSDPSSDRLYQPSKQQRRREKHASPRLRSNSPSVYSDGATESVEILPDRFDNEGRPLDRFGNRFGRREARRGDDAQGEMMEKIVMGVGDVVDGRKSWKDILMGLVDEPGSAASGSSEDVRRKRSRR